MTKEREFDLQDRLIDYSVRIIALSEALPETKAGKHIALQITPETSSGCKHLEIGYSLLAVGCSKWGRTTNALQVVDGTLISPTTGAEFLTERRGGTVKSSMVSAD